MTAEDEGVQGARDGDGRPYPMPPFIYEKIRAEATRPLLVLVLWDEATASGPSMMAVTQAGAEVFFATCPG
jgi:hypothetical protein